jgi:hypothetical protein
MRNIPDESEIDPRVLKPIPVPALVSPASISVRDAIKGEEEPPAPTAADAWNDPAIRTGDPSLATEPLVSAGSTAVAEEGEAIRAVVPISVKADGPSRSGREATPNLRRRGVLETDRPVILFLDQLRTNRSSLFGFMQRSC